MIKVQGRDRLYVKYIAEQLGLEGSYIARTYIEQIQLEKLVNDVMVWTSQLIMLVCDLSALLNPINLQALPDDLKTKLSIDDDLVSSPKEALSRASADRRNKYLSRYSNSLIKFIAWETRRECMMMWPQNNCFFFLSSIAISFCLRDRLLQYHSKDFALNLSGNPKIFEKFVELICLSWYTMYMLDSGISRSFSSRDKNLTKLARVAVNNKRFDIRGPDSPATLANEVSCFSV